MAGSESHREGRTNTGKQESMREQSGKGQGEAREPPGGKIMGFTKVGKVKRERILDNLRLRSVLFSVSQGSLLST